MVKWVALNVTPIWLQLGGVEQDILSILYLWSWDSGESETAEKINAGEGVGCEGVGVWEGVGGEGWGGVWLQVCEGEGVHEEVKSVYVRYVGALQLVFSGSLPLPRWPTRC